ncbi:MAG: hypothetical protein ABIJ45_14460 [Candidatus Zixiibacteriota bacterium]
MKVISKNRKEKLMLTAVIIIFTLMLSVSSVMGQQMMQMKIESEGEVLMLQEVGGLVIDSDDGVRIDMVLPSDQRTESYQKTDLQAGDLIKMVNGKKIENTEQLKEIYEKANFGDEIKFGLLREKKMMIVPLIKANPDDLPGQMMVMTIETDGPPPIMALINAGLILAEAEDNIIVDKVMDKIAEKQLSALPKKGDVLLRIQNQKIENRNQLISIVDNTKVGEKIELVFSNSEKEYPITFTQSEKNDGPLKKVQIKKN